MRNVHFFAAMLFLMVAMVATSCESDEGNNIQPEEEEETAGQKALREMVSGARFEVTKKETLTAEQMVERILGPAGSNDDETKEEIREKFIKRHQEYEESLSNALGANGLSMMYETGNFYYWSNDADGDPIKLSAFYSVGTYWWFGTKYCDQDNIYQVCPYTHTANKECATQDNGGYEFLLFECTDNLFIMPDGQGFGTDWENTQPYLNHNLQSQQIYDALVAGYNMYLNDGGKMEKDFKLRVIGASQGAGDAIAVHRLLDTRIQESTGKTYGQVWNFDYSFVAVGPYSPATTMEHYYTHPVLDYPVVVPMVIKSMLDGNPKLREKYRESQFYSAAYNKVKSKYDEFYRHKAWTTDQINAEMSDDFNSAEEKEYLKKAGYDPDHNVDIRKILSAEVLDINSEIYKDFMNCLLEQDLTTGWKPRTRTYMYATSGDKIVPHINSDLLDMLFTSNGVKTDLTYMLWNGEPMSHVGACKWLFLNPW